MPFLPPEIDTIRTVLAETGVPRKAVRYRRLSGGEAYEAYIVDPEWAAYVGESAHACAQQCGLDLWVIRHRCGHVAQVRIRLEADPGSGTVTALRDRSACSECSEREAQQPAEITTYMVRTQELTGDDEVIRGTTEVTIVDAAELDGHVYVHYGITAEQLHAMLGGTTSYGYTRIVRPGQNDLGLYIARITPNAPFFRQLANRHGWRLTPRVDQWIMDHTARPWDRPRAGDRIRTADGEVITVRHVARTYAEETPRFVGDPYPIPAGTVTVCADEPASRYVRLYPGEWAFA